MKILHISDIHGNLNIFKEACTNYSDIVVISGDFFPNILKDGVNHGNKEDDIKYQTRFLETNKDEIIKYLNERPLIYVQGNHDWINLSQLHYKNMYELNNSSLTLHNFNFYGFPNTPHMNQWNYYTPEQDFNKIIENIPTSTDILITHVPPKDVLDDNKRSDHIGIANLTNKINQTNIKFHLFGHIHKNNKTISLAKTLYSNSSYTYRIIEVEDIKMNNDIIKKMENKMLHNENENIEKYYYYLLPELSKLKNEGDVKGFLSNVNLQEIVKLKINTNTRNIIKQFKHQKEIKEYINSLSYYEIIKLTEILSKNWRKNSVYDQLTNSNYIWNKKKVPMDYIYISNAEPNLSSLFNFHNYKLLDITNDKELWINKPYNKKDFSSSKIKFPICLAKKINNKKYLIFDGIHRAIRMAHDKEKNIDIYYYENIETKYSPVSAIILCKDEGYNIIDTINNLKPYLDEIIIIDSSTNENATITNKICKDLDCKYEYINTSEIADLRNYGNKIAKNEWCLHVDVDEIFSDIFLNNINDIINNKNIINTTPPQAYKFPRINLPFYEKYPDYQIRLMNKKHSEWIGEVHEKVKVLDILKKIEPLDKYPIIHKKKNQNTKLEINKRWNILKRKNNTLIVSLFNNCEKWISDFLNNLSNLIDYSLANNNIDIVFIEGNSNDKTYEKLNEWSKVINKKLRKEKYKLIKADIYNKINRFEKLAILRNIAIKNSLIQNDYNDYDYILMIDSDTIFKEDLLNNLINSLKNNKVDVIAPMIYIDNYKTYGNTYFYDTLAFRKNNEPFSHYFPYINTKNTNNINNVNNTNNINNVNNTNNINNVNKNKTIEVDSVGTCYLIKGELYNINDFQNFNIIKCYEESKHKELNIYTGENDSEHVEFCNRLRKKGYKIMVDTNIEVYHINLLNYDLKWH